MSRLGKKIIPIPAGVEAKFEAGVFSVKGPKGSLKREINDKVGVVIDGANLTTNIKNGSENESAIWGTYASHILNMLDGVTKGFEKKLQIEGIGFKAEVKGNTIVFNLGFSHQITLEIPEGLAVTHEKGNLTVSGIDKEAVGAFAAKIRDLKKPEPYKGKGIKYADERILRKSGKSGKDK